MSTVILSKGVTRMRDASAVVRRAVNKAGVTKVIFPKGRVYCPSMSLNVPAGVELINATISGGFRIPDNRWSHLSASDPNYALITGNKDTDVWVCEFASLGGPSAGTWPTTWDTPGVVDAGLHIDGVPATRANSGWLLPSSSTTTSLTFASLPTGITANGQLQFRGFAAQEYDDNTIRIITSITGSNTILNWSGSVTWGSGSKRILLENHPALMTAAGMFWIDADRRRVYYRGTTAPTNACIDTVPGNDTNANTGAVVKWESRSAGKASNLRVESSRGTGISLYNSSGVILSGQTSVIGCLRGFEMASGANDHTNNAIVSIDARYCGLRCIRIDSGNHLTATARTNTFGMITGMYSGLRSVKWGEIIQLQGYAFNCIGNVWAQYGPRFGVIFNVANADFEDNDVCDVCQLTGDTGAIYFTGNTRICPERRITGNRIERFGAPVSIMGLFPNSRNAGIYGDNWASDWRATGNYIAVGDYGMHSNSGHTFTFTGNTFGTLTTNRIMINQGSSTAGGDTGNSTVFDLAAAIRSVYQSISPTLYAKTSVDATDWQKPSGIDVSGNGSAGVGDSIAVTWPTGNTESVET